MDLLIRLHDYFYSWKFVALFKHKTTLLFQIRRCFIIQTAYSFLAVIKAQERERESEGGERERKCMWELERKRKCVCERESVCVWEKERAFVCVWEREKERNCVWERDNMCERKRETVTEREKVCERERDNIKVSIRTPAWQRQNRLFLTWPNPTNVKPLLT